MVKMNRSQRKEQFLELEHMRISYLCIIWDNTIRIRNIITQKHKDGHQYMTDSNIPNYQRIIILVQVNMINSESCIVEIRLIHNIIASNHQHLVMVKEQNMQEGLRRQVQDHIELQVISDMLMSWHETKKKKKNQPLQHMVSHQINQVFMRVHLQANEDQLRINQ